MGFQNNVGGRSEPRYLRRSREPRTARTGVLSFCVLNNISSFITHATSRPTNRGEQRGDHRHVLPPMRQTQMLTLEHMHIRSYRPPSGLVGIRIAGFRSCCSPCYNACRARRRHSVRRRERGTARRCGADGGQAWRCTGRGGWWGAGCEERSVGAREGCVGWAGGRTGGGGAQVGRGAERTS